MRMLKLAYWRRKKHKYYEAIITRLDWIRLKPFSSSLLFIDAGSNLGQGYRWFSNIYKHQDIVFDLFEPNPNCMRKLTANVLETKRKATVLNEALATTNGILNFYGTADDEGGSTSQGGSLNKHHNSLYYQASDEKSIQVVSRNINEYLLEKKSLYSKMVLKMDIEGGELDVLSSMLENKTMCFLDTLYIEFHSQYQQEPDKTRIRNIEERLIEEMKGLGVNVRIWH